MVGALGLEEYVPLKGESAACFHGMKEGILSEVDPAEGSLTSETF